MCFRQVLDMILWIFAAPWNVTLHFFRLFTRRRTARGNTIQAFCHRTTAELAVGSAEGATLSSQKKGKQPFAVTATPVPAIGVASDPQLPFVKANLTFSSEGCEKPEVSVIYRQPCLWDSGAIISCVPASILWPKEKDDEVALEKRCGFMDMYIRFPEIDYTVQVKTSLPNGADFVILGQYAFLRYLTYKTTPEFVPLDTSSLPAPRAVTVIPYGKIEFTKYQVPGSDGVVGFSNT